MNYRIFQIDAFSDVVFHGNPAAVCPLTSWLEDAVLQAIAEENNLSETAFFVGSDGNYALRWFTPGIEVDLCGHATLAAAWVLFNELGETAAQIRFQTRSGELRVGRSGDKLVMDFPEQVAVACNPPEGLLASLGVEALEILAAEDYLVVVDSEKTVREITPDFFGLKGLPLRGVIVTAQGDDVDFVSRWFGPNVGVNEDPVTGSSHTSLTPYWATRLGKNDLTAGQVSRRGGKLQCRLAEGRVFITGSAVKYMEGRLFLRS